MIRLFCFALLCLLAKPSDLVAQGVRVKYNFNSDWKVLVGDDKSASSPDFNDIGWKQVTLPYAWNEDDAYKKDIVDHTTAISWYRKHFRLPQSAAGQKIFIEFEGIRQAGDFYVNGKHVGLHENGVMAFGFDISTLVKFGNEENVIAVRVDNDWEYKEKATQTKFQWEDKNFNANYGGITKNVYLHITPKLYQTLPLYSNLQTTGTYVFADNFNVKGKSATLHAESQVKNETGVAQQVSYEVSVKDAGGKVISTFSGATLELAPGETKVFKGAAEVKNLNFWSWGYGYLYDVSTRLKVGGKVVDEVNTRTGVRKTAFENGMIYLNDRVIMVHGYAQRTSNEWPAIGLSVPAWLSDYSNGLLVESGGNLVRWMHTTPWKQDIESCDRVGLMQSMQAGDAEHDIEGIQWDQRKAVMRDAIIYNRNSPSILFYESGNESISDPHMSEMKAIRDTYDPSGGRAIGSREMLDSKVAEYGGEMLYTNKSAQIPMWAMEYSRDEGSRKYWDDFTPPFHKDGAGPDTYRSVTTNQIQKRTDAYLYNRNMDSHAVEDVKRWFEFWQERPGTGKRVSSGGVNIVWSDTNTHYRGEENFRRSGEVDALRIPKQNFFAHQVMWDGWVNPEKHRLHIVGHWNYKEGVKKNIFVVSTAEKVELKINGRSQGFGTKSDGFLYTFTDIEWQKGTISATGFDASGKTVCSAQIITTGAPVALRLKSIKRPTAFVADGHDLALVEVEVVDAAGNRCPTALDMISYSLTGPAEWRGGIAMGPENYILKKEFPVEGGVNRFLIRSTTQAGTVKVTASAAGLKPASITLTTIPFATKNGLATQLPSAGLSSKLDRGPTPSGPSFAKTRTPIGISQAIAGANISKTASSYDDNELSEWNNDGNLATAWIEYTLEREAEINEVTIKMTNFGRPYPIRITVDGKEAFSGSTKSSRGYCTLSFQPQKGKTVRIQLLASDRPGQSTETQTAAPRDQPNRGALGITELEMYEGVRL